MHSARRGLSQLLIFKFLRHIFIRHSVLRKASRLKSYCKFNNYFLNPHLFLKKSFGFNFRLQIKASFTLSPIQPLFTKHFLPFPCQHEITPPFTSQSSTYICLIPSCSTSGSLSIVRRYLG